MCAPRLPMYLPSVPSPTPSPPPPSYIQPELYGAAGMGLYDPPALSRSPLYFSIYSEGGLTLRCVVCVCVCVRARALIDA